MKIYKIPMSGADVSTGGTRMPSSLEDLLGSHSKDEPSTSRDISTRIGALKARLTRATAASGGTTAPDVRLSSPHLTEPSYRRASVGGGEPGRLASEIPRSSLSDVHYSEELYSARYNEQAASSSTLEVEMLKRRMVELENEVIVLRNENEALRNRLTIACTQGLCRSAINQSAMNASHAPAPRQNVTSATVSNIRPAALDMSDFERQWQAIEAGVSNCVDRTSVSDPPQMESHTPNTAISPSIGNSALTRSRASIMSASRISTTPPVWCNDAHRKSRKLNKEIEEALGNAIASSNTGLSFTACGNADRGSLGKQTQTPNPHTITTKVALPTAGNCKEAVAPRLVGIDEDADEPCIVWKRETASGLVPSGALSLEHITECLYGEHARTFRGWIIALRKDGEQKSIADLIDQWAALPSERLSLIPKIGHPNTIVLVSRTRALCFEIHHTEDYTIWVNYLVQKLNGL
ncbi:Hypothetical protein DHA2_151657 [Giardia duodenalis]|uniref:Uncharacterized protein n=1 Tax=Giardia intestinalis TaxID=5741 RepID=V6TMA0_GIAIN|nr:Hypothetical protein DHA2_151657 [Giardia intestinalis]